MKGGRKALQEKKQFGFFAKICRPDFWILLLSLILSVDVVDQRKKQFVKNRNFPKFSGEVCSSKSKVERFEQSAVIV